ncbi:MAG: hypothetical protein M1368_07625 [Thaumarchaeota archaeon]|nr:hypothetical protein [Nitrososphaerota archaeon]
MAKGGIEAFDALTLLDSGSVNVTVNGFPLAKVDCDKKDIEVEMRGVHESGIKIFHIARSGTELTGVLREAQELASGLSRAGWQLKLYNMGAPALTMGRGVSRLTAHISVNPLKLRRLFKDLLL